MPAKWYVTHLDEEAASEVASLFKKSENIEHEIRRILRLLADEDDPRKPKSAQLDVKEVEFAAPGWYRVAIHRYAIRIIFRLLVVRGKQRIDVGKEPIYPEDRGAIDITRAKHRDEDPYGKELRERYKRLRAR